jgi:hypothetical protein
MGRGQLALDIVIERLRLTGVHCDELRCDLIGANALHPGGPAAPTHDPYEVRARVSARVASARAAERIGREVEALYTNGPAGGGGAVKSVRDVLAIGTTFVARELVRCAIQYETIS